MRFAKSSLKTPRPRSAEGPKTTPADQDDEDDQPAENGRCLRVREHSCDLPEPRRLAAGAGQAPDDEPQPGGPDQPGGHEREGDGSGDAGDDVSYDPEVVACRLQTKPSGRPVRRNPGAKRESSADGRQQQHQRRQRGASAGRGDFAVERRVQPQGAEQPVGEAACPWLPASTPRRLWRSV